MSIRSCNLVVGSLVAGVASMACTIDVYSGDDGGVLPPTDRGDAGVAAPTCKDGIKNQGEEKIDCGGPCKACATKATCSDGKKNQGEEGVDCGGPCKACAEGPSCSDGKKNQGEEGVDCGGPCDACESCEDGIQNQDEEGVDCGGTCDACEAEPSCSDGAQNQGEEGVDCGGPCDACEVAPSCSDGMKNQDEERVDCGGVCEPCPSLQGAKFIGNITQGGGLPDDFGMWNQLTPENEGKWQSMEPNRDEMQWARMDEYYAYTRERGIPLKGHTLCWGNQAPEWIEDLEPEEQAAEVEEYIQKFCERYPQIELIDVVNEPDHAVPAYKDALGGEGETGHDWVLQCFEWAREYCPNSTLILNDYNVLRWETDQFVAIAEKVKAAGFLDAVGAQAHGLESLAFNELRFNLNKLAKLEVPIYISEYDVDVVGDEAQLRIFEQQFPLFYNHPQVVGITLWGYHEGATWRPNTHLMLVDGTYRPAFEWLTYHYLSDERACGNGACEDGETCSTCSLDCGECN
jgi:GH35 family endo-1,4-beta-xylanase